MPNKFRRYLRARHQQSRYEKRENQKLKIGLRRLEGAHTAGDALSAIYHGRSAFFISLSDVKAFGLSHDALSYSHSAMKPLYPPSLRSGVIQSLLVLTLVSRSVIKVARPCHGS